MTTAQHNPAAVPGRASSATPRAAERVTFGRLIAVEARKLVDTRASLWLLIATFALAIGAVVVTLFAGRQIAPGTPMDAGDLVAMGVNSLTLLLPVLAILLATGEWTQRGAMVTFTIEPRRLRVLAAKLVSIVILTLVLSALVVALTLGVAGVAGALGYSTIDWQLDAAGISWIVVSALLSTLMGFALGTLLMNTPAAIVVYFLAPVALAAASALGERVAEITSWLNMGTAITPLTSDLAGPVNWGKIAVSVGVWVIVPLVAGGVRLVRREVN